MYNIVNCTKTLLFYSDREKPSFGTPRARGCQNLTRQKGEEMDTDSIPELQMHNRLKETDVKNLKIITDEEFSEIVDSMLLNDYKNIPNVVRLPNIRNDLAEKLGLEKDAAFIMKDGISHIRPGRKMIYGQALDDEEYRAIPKIIREATFAIIDKRYNNFQFVFDDEENKKMINKLVFNKDKAGNYLVTVGKVNRMDSLSKSINEVVGVGVAPTISALRREPPATRLRPSPTTDNSVLHENNSVNKTKDFEDAFRQLDAYIENGIVPKNSRIQLPNTPESLKALGIDDTVVTLPISVIKKAVNVHDLSAIEIKKALQSLYDPVLIFDSDKMSTENKAPSKLIFTDVMKDSRPIAIALNTDANLTLKDKDEKVNIEVQDIRSIHERTLTAKNGTDVIKKWTEEGLCRYVDDKKISDWTSIARVYFPIELIQSDSRNILTKEDVVKRMLLDKENEKFVTFNDGTKVFGEDANKVQQAKLNLPRRKDDLKDAKKQLEDYEKSNFPEREDLIRRKQEEIAKLEKLIARYENTVKKAVERAKKENIKTTAVESKEEKTMETSKETNGEYQTVKETALKGEENNREADKYRGSEYKVTKELYKNASQEELKRLMNQSKDDKEIYSEFISKYEKELENPSNRGIFATIESIAENERALRANLKSYKLHFAQEEGKQKALTEMLNKFEEIMHEDSSVNKTNELLKVIDRTETLYFNSDKKSGDMYQILVDKALKDEIAPELRDLERGEELVVEYRKWVRADESEYDFSASIMKYEDGSYHVQRDKGLSGVGNMAMDMLNLMGEGGNETYRTDKLQDNDTSRDLKARIRNLVANYEKERVQTKGEIATNFVLERLKEAGIEVVAEKEEFNRILEEEKLLQRMVESGENPEKIEHQKQFINGLVVNHNQGGLELSEDNIANAFKQLDRSLRFNANFEVQSEKLGEEVSVFPGSTGKHGLGIRHIIEERTKKDNLSLDEITALSSLIVDAVQTGDITRDSKGQVEFTKNGIVAIVRKDYFGNEKNWILTGFAYNSQSNAEKNREATEAIQTVIAKYGQSPDYSYFRSQVGAVVASLDLNISQIPVKSSDVSKIVIQNDETEVKDNGISVTSLKTETINKKAVIRSPNDTYELLSHIKNEEQEHFGTILLDTARNVKAINTVTVGTINSSLVHQREVFSEAIRQKAAAIIVFHNHPSGNPLPSENDLHTTQMLLKASEVVGIPILDHVIVTEDNYYSFLERGILDNLKSKTEFLINDNRTYGFTHNGKIYLDPEIMNSNVAVHEYTHLWDKYTQNTNPELWERGKDILSKTHLWSEVKADPNYADISNDDDLVLSEVHSRICGKIAQKVLEQIAEQDGEITRDKVIDWDKETWNYLSNEFLTAEDKEILFEKELSENQINEFISLSLKDLMEEKEISLSQSMEQSKTFKEGKKPKTTALELKSDNPKERAKEITSQLERGVKDLFESKKYQEYLDVMSRFHRYSTNNLQLIALQNPDATQVAGFQTWKKDFERSVKKGEKGIKILVPVVYKKKAKEHENILEEGIDSEKSEKEESKRDNKEYLTFRIGHVFDISQTEGKDLPSLGANELSGNVEQYSEMYSALEKLSPYPISFEDINSAAKGYCSFSGKKIVVKNGMSETQTIKTLIHEITHAKLHEKLHEDRTLDKRAAEVQAESVSYTVCKHFGLDTSDYSFAYITGWSSGKDTKELKESLELIRATSVEFIENIEETTSKKISQKKTMVVESQEEKKMSENYETTIKKMIDEERARMQGSPSNNNILKEPKVEINGEMTECYPLLNDHRWIDGREMPVEIIANAIDYINEKTEYSESKSFDIDSIPEEIKKDAISVALKNCIKDGKYSYLVDKGNLRQDAFDREVMRFNSEFKDTAKLMFETLNELNEVEKPVETTPKQNNAKIVADLDLNYQSKASRIADLDLENPYKNRLSKRGFSGTLIPYYNAKAIKEGMETHPQRVPFLPNEKGEINAHPIYNANTGDVLSLKDLIPMQIKLGENCTPIAATKRSIDSAHSSIKMGETGMFYNFKRKDGTIGTSQYFFPEQTEHPERVIQSANEKIAERKQHYMSNEHGVIAKNTIEITSSEPKEYLGKYYAAMRTNSFLKCSPEIAKDFKEKFNRVLDNQLAEKENFKPEIGTLHKLFFDAGTVSNDIVKQIDQRNSHIQEQQKKQERNRKPEMSR